MLSKQSSSKRAYNYIKVIFGITPKIYNYRNAKHTDCQSTKYYWQIKYFFFINFDFRINHHDIQYDFKRMMWKYLVIAILFAIITMKRVIIKTMLDLKIYNSVLRPRSTYTSVYFVFLLSAAWTFLMNSTAKYIIWCLRRNQKPQLALPIISWQITKELWLPYLLSLLNEYATKKTL